MPYVLRKAPRREAYWVVNQDTGKKHSIDPLPRKKAEAQMRLLYAVEGGYPLRKSGGAKGRTASEEELRKIFEAYEEGRMYPPSPTPPPRTPTPKPKRKSPPKQKILYNIAKQEGQGGDEPEEKPILEVSKSAPSFPIGIPEPEPYVTSQDVKDIEYAGSGFFDTLKKLNSGLTTGLKGITNATKYLKSGLEEGKKGNLDKLSNIVSAVNLGKKITGGSYYPEQNRTHPITIRKPTGYKSPAILRLAEQRAIEKSKLDESTRRRLGIVSRGSIV